MWNQIVIGVVVTVMGAGVLYGVKCLWGAWRRKASGSQEARTSPESPHSSEPGDPLAASLDEVGRVVARYGVSWAAERDSDPINADEGKHILERLGDELVDCRVSLHGKISEHAIAEIDKVITATRAIQKHQLFLDAGKSFRAFWQRGDAMFAQINDVVSTLRGA